MLDTIKSMGLFPCPRCLVVKGDIPEVGSYLDMKNHQKNTRTYSIENVEIARKAIFDSGRSISYRGPYNILKTGSWVPTRVCSFYMHSLQVVDSVTPERLCNRTRPQPTHTVLEYNVLSHRSTYFVCTCLQSTAHRL